MRKSLPILAIFMLLSCEDTPDSRLKRFSRDLATIDCDHLYSCCIDNGGMKNTDYDSYEECLAGQTEDNFSLFNEKNFTYIEENLEPLLETYRALLSKGCDYQITVAEDAQFERMYLDTFWGHKVSGESCDTDKECAQGLSCAVTEEYDLYCTPFALEDEDCMFADCAYGLECLGAVCRGPMTEGDACIGYQCAGLDLFCNQDSQLCESRRAVGEACTLDTQCESDNCGLEETCGEALTIIERVCAGAQ